MKLLAIETTAAVASVCLMRDGVAQGLRFSRSEMNHLTELTPMIRDLPWECEMGFEDLDGIAVSIGPGSFTGMRIGVSTARALAQTTGLPIIAVPTLEVYACQDMSFDGVVCSILDARLSSVYSAAYLGMGGKASSLTHILTQGAYEYDVFIEKVDAALVFASKEFDKTAQRKRELRIFGDGLSAMGEERVQEIFSIAESRGLSVRTFSDSDCLRDASHTGTWASIFGSPLPFDDVEPLYIRKAEAQRRMDVGLLKPHV